jgi:Bacterial PH domain
VQWSPRIGETAALGAVGLGLALAVLAVDTAGRLLVGAAALLVVALAARDAAVRPRLSAGPEGIVVRRLGGRVELPWRGLRIQVQTTRRFGVRNRVLELDTAAGPEDGGTLVLLGRRDLGTDPEDVARALRRLAPLDPPAA